jgi:hypothetical protein
MNELFNRLNLNPLERRLLVGIMGVLFVVINLWLIWPRFGDWGRVNTEFKAAQVKLKNYELELDARRVEEYTKMMAEMEKEGQAVLPSEQSLDLARTIQNQAGAYGVVINSSVEVAFSGGKTNEYFDEKARRVSITAGEKELLDFLTSLSGNSMIRARSLTLRPDPSQMRLQAEITLVASYQKKKAPVSLAQAATKLEPKNAAPVKTPPPAKTEPPKKAQVAPKNEPPKKGEPARKSEPSTNKSIPVRPPQIPKAAPGVAPKGATSAPPARTLPMAPGGARPKTFPRTNQPPNSM